MPTPGNEPLSEWNASDADLLRKLFLEEADDHLQRVAESVGALSRHAGSDVLGNEAEQAVNGLLRALHTLKGAAGSVGFDTIAQATHELEELCAEIRSGSLSPTPGILDRLDDGVASLRALLDGARVAPLRRPPETAPLATEGPAERRQGADRRSADRVAAERGVRVNADRLDALLDAVGDLVILRTRIDRRVAELEGVRRDVEQSRAGFRRALAALSGNLAADPHAPQAALDRLAESDLEIANALGYLERATGGVVAEVEALRRATEHLDAEVRRARLVPVETIYLRLAAALREIERAGNPKVELVMSGANLELDKSVVEQLQDPLLHLLRNAVAHGIEPAPLRVANGKRPMGRIEIAMRVEGEHVFVTFSDDGRGVDAGKVAATLVGAGRLPVGSGVDPSLLAQVLFEPGFSTLSTADALAGRGMGLNVVKTAVVKLGGDVTLDSLAGQGARFRIVVPLTTAITEAFLIKLGGQVYAVPTAHVLEALPPFAGDVSPSSSSSGMPTLPSSAIEAAETPILRLQALLGLEMSPDHKTAALRLRYGDRSFVVTCDRLIGPRTIVVRPLGPLLSLVPYLSGVTVSGAGKAQLVLDVAALAQAAHGPARSVPVPPRRGRPRVLVVDDSRLTREAAARILAAAGFQAVTAEDGWEAWEMLGERRFDALVTDLDMPRLDGYELIGRVRRDATLRGLPVVVLSSRTSRAARDRALEAGADVVIPKAPSRRVLSEALQALLTRLPDAAARLGGRTE